MASSIAGTEAMSGLLAIVNISEADFNKLSTAIANSDSTAADMAKTMQDNLKGRLTELESGLEGLGIKFYEYMQQPLKEAAKAGIKAVQQLSKSLQGGALGDSVKKLGKSFGDFATATANFAAKAMPKVISGLSWLLPNAGKIAAVLVTIKTAMTMHV